MNTYNPKISCDDTLNWKQSKETYQGPRPHEKNNKTNEQTPFYKNLFSSTKKSIEYKKLVSNQDKQSADTGTSDIYTLCEPKGDPNKHQHNANNLQSITELCSETTKDELIGKPGLGVGFWVLVVVYALLSILIIILGIIFRKEVALAAVNLSLSLKKASIW
ncbi:hypothetical protein BB558_000282 [Smittium angustum]|nr:hypothetical protein BB558_000282 [Smittium angustum]